MYTSNNTVDMFRALSKTGITTMMVSDSTLIASSFSATASLQLWTHGRYVEITIAALFQFIACTVVAHTAQGVQQRAAWKKAANNRVLLQDTVRVIKHLRKLATTGLAAPYDNYFVVCSVRIVSTRYMSFCYNCTGGTTCPHTEHWVVSADELHGARAAGGHPCTTKPQRPGDGHVPLYHGGAQ